MKMSMSAYGIDFIVMSSMFLLYFKKFYILLFRLQGSGATDELMTKQVGGEKTNKGTPTAKGAVVTNTPTSKDATKGAVKTGAA